MFTESKNCQPLRQAAVVVLVRGERYQQPEVLLVKRAKHLNSHAGEVGLPGGMVESIDKDLWHTALREAHEEVGLRAESVVYQQALAHSYTRQGIRVAPFVALWQEEHPLQLCSDEIESAFWLPLDFLRQDQRVRTDVFTQGEREYWSPVYRYANYVIWGFTARLLVEFMNNCHRAGISRIHPAPVARFKPKNG